MAQRAETLWDMIRGAIGGNEEQSQIPQPQSIPYDDSTPVVDSNSMSLLSNPPSLSQLPSSFRPSAASLSQIPESERQNVYGSGDAYMQSTPDSFDMSSVQPGADTFTQGAYDSMKPEAPEEEQGFMSKMGDGIGDFFGDEEKMARLTIGLNSMRLNPDASLAKSMESRLTSLRKNKALSGGVVWLREYAMKQTDPVKRKQFLDMADMAEKNPTLAKSIVEKGMQEAHGIGAKENKPYEPRNDEEGKEYIPVYNPNTNTVDKVYTGTTGMSPKQKISFETEEKIRQADVGRKDKKVAEMGGTIANVNGQINKMDGIIQSLDDGAWSGFVANYLPTLTTATANMIQLRNQLGLDVVSSVTFGALSATELALAMETAVPPGLGPLELKKWAVAKVQAMRKFNNEMYKKTEGLARADGYNSWLIEEANLAEKNSKLNYHNLPNDMKEAMRNSTLKIDYSAWQKKNNKQRKDFVDLYRK